ncbi:LPS-assembly protein LptD [Microvirga sp. W0021]|uniref:LPS-assembly protein LptD n=1 Tax=Hohaiivirga grylli TaxID=3133970 RepID=A0ABV0BIY4_9HYPH
MGRLRFIVASTAMAVVLVSAAAVDSAFAQGTLNDVISAKTQGQKADGQQDRLFVEAKELIYNNDKNTIAASGNVELHYQGRTLQADRVTYDRTTGRVFAKGNARMTDASGTIMTGSEFELTDDFKSGFINSLYLEQKSVENGKPITGHFSSPRAERIDGETTVFNRGIYTACDSCKDDPSRPPLWQVKAARIIHNNSERTIYYENATLEFAGIPVAYMPYFWSPDPTVKRKTGFLAPRYIYGSSLGAGVQIPFFWNLAPNYDLTLRPTFLSEQGFLGEAEWRHRLETGSYNIRAAGIFQQSPGEFIISPFGPGDRNFRGSLESNGQFNINPYWKWGWNATLVTDKWFLDNYHVRSRNLTDLFYREAISTVYLRGNGDRSFFDLRGYYFQGLSSYDWQKQQPVVHPVLDYNKRFNPAGIGGELSLDINLTSLTRQAAAYQQIPTQVTKLSGTIYDTCAVYERGKCLVRGIAGTTTRASANLSWRREFIDPIGQVWTPFAFLRGDVFYVRPDNTGYQNAYQNNFWRSDENDFSGRFMPGAGLEYRFPFVADFGSNAKQVFEPIAQIVVRPNESKVGRLPNEDAQSLLFDDTTIFEWNKFSGYDRVEGGTRANVGAQYSITADNGAYANILFGQSFQVAGRNSYDIADIANTGLGSGLDKSSSDYVGRVLFSPNKNYTFISRARFDQNSFGLRRFETGISANFNPVLPLQTSVMFATYAPQPEIGLGYRRTGIMGSVSYNLNKNWYVTGSAVVDLDRRARAEAIYEANYAISPETASYYKKDRIALDSLSVGFGYSDECTDLSLNYIVAPRDLSSTTGLTERNQTIMLRLELKSLGAIAAKQNVSDGS